MVATFIIATAIVAVAVIALIVSLIFVALVVAFTRLAGSKRPEQAVRLVVQSGGEEQRIARSRGCIIAEAQAP